MLYNNVQTNIILSSYVLGVLLLGRMEAALPPHNSHTYKERLALCKSVIKFS